MSTFIDPASLAQIQHLPLVAKCIAEGVLFGRSPGRQRGTGDEFSQYRRYQHGDPLKQIDWKLYARSDRYFVREAQRETDLQLWLLVDYSRSMQMRSHFAPHQTPPAKRSRSANVKPHSKNRSRRPASPWNKLRYAQCLAASLAYLAQYHGDRSGFIGLSDQGLTLLPPGRGMQHWQQLLHHLDSTASGQRFPEPHTLSAALNAINKPALIVVLSDFYQRQDEITDSLSQLDRSRCEVLAMQLLCDDEVHNRFRGTLRVHDLESREHCTVEAEQLRQSLPQRLQHQQYQLKRGLAAQQIRHHTFNIDQALDPALHRFLAQRQGLRR